MPTQVNGLPAHILLVHLVIALVPAAAALVLIAGVWPAARRWLNWLPVLAALAALASVPLATHAGRWLEAHLRGELTPAIRHHVSLGNQMLAWVIALFAAAVAVWIVAIVEGRRGLAIGGSPTAPAPARSLRVRMAMRIVVAALAVVAAVGATQQVIRTGEAGSRAVWSGTVDS